MLSLSIECVVCADAFEDADCLHAPCLHYFCRQCLMNMAEAANRDESLLPLQCCHKQLPTETFLQFLPESVRAAFYAKSAEASTPPPQRLYCPNKKCSIFLGKSSGEGSLHDIACPECSTAVCSGCKTRAHPREDCKENELAIEARALATAKGWQTCPGCKAIVELKDGCYHMTCRCQTQFCYGCGAKWKTCGC
ncbi:hypothetical protein HYDPIDRAFT_101186 [Hydnomerulius pinastri MD-312]|uniref:RBR-type E3 ubiquitin transferase n=1 Tax=Hydnomerulius pinastri MD-312 TaxID=994086 RepID=A0A0C9W8X8_9AGAM|nr:hypothetical protein HYDPIDRAFT_101186 [Hydnomerulius pinastri MD-312]